MFHTKPEFMSADRFDFTFVEDQHGLEAFRRDNERASWMSFDTEFIGEKRYVTRLCLLQVGTERGNYLIDPFAVALDPLLEMIEDPSVLKITHAGENDYRILNYQFGTLPANVFDTQIAAGFVGYRYPVSFGKLVENELDINLSKGYTVADWESRPFTKKQLRYALDDILHLRDLWRALSGKLENYGRTSWARAEFRRLERAETYEFDPNKEALNSNLIKSLKRREQVFLIRLFNWRRQLAEEKNHSKEMVLPNKMMSQIVKSIRSGREALKENRRIPDKISKRYGDTFQELYQRQITEAEKQLLRQITNGEVEDPKEEILLDMLYLVMKYKCQEEGVAPSLVFSKSTLKKTKTDEALRRELVEDSWRGEFLGSTFFEWVKNSDRLDLDLSREGIELKLTD